MDPAVQVAFASGMGALVGAGISGLVALLSGWRERVGGDLRQRRELAVRLALAEHEQNWRIAEHQLAQGRRVDLYPLDMLILRHAALLDVLGRRTVSADDVDEVQGHIHRLDVRATANAERHTEDLKRERRS